MSPIFGFAISLTKLYSMLPLYTVLLIKILVDNETEPNHGHKL